MPHDAINRRHFTAHLAGGAAALTGSVALAAEPAVVEAPAKLASTSSLDLLLELVKRLDPDRLTDEHLEQLRIDLASNQQRSKRLSGFPLTNADEPAPVFAAWRSEG
jgi:hypothetical protein